MLNRRLKAKQVDSLIGARTQLCQTRRAAPTAGEGGLEARRIVEDIVGTGY